MVGVRQEALDRDGVDRQVALGPAGRVVVANLDPDALRSGDRSLDLLADVAQTLDPLAEKVRLAAKFLAGVRWGEILSLEVLGGHVPVAHLRICHSQGRSDVQGRATLDPDARRWANLGQDVLVDRELRMEVLNSTKFGYELTP